MTPIQRATTTYAGTHNSQCAGFQTTNTWRLFVTVAIISLLACRPGVTHSQATSAETAYSETQNAALAYLNAHRAIALEGANAQNEAASAQTVADNVAIHKVAIQEGFPVAQLQRLKNRDAALRARSRVSFAPTQAVISPQKVWSEKELPLKTAFLGGSDELRDRLFRPWQLGAQAAASALTSAHPAHIASGLATTRSTRPTCASPSMKEATGRSSTYLLLTFKRLLSLIP